jgi:DNA-binding XRE family transcriptional regulator
VPVVLKALKRKEMYKTPESLAEHLVARRRELSVTQAQVAKAIGVSEATVYNWENERTSPPLLLWKAIIAFLGYDPNIEACGDTLSARLKAWRRAHGRSIKQAAQYVGVDEST